MDKNFPIFLLKLEKKTHKKNEFFLLKFLFNQDFKKFMIQVEQILNEYYISPNKYI